MAPRTGSLLLVLLIGFISSISFAQDLTTECWSSDWTKYLEKCYLVVSYKHSWAKANEYCKKYGARLAEPAGITVNSNISTLVKDAGISDFWIGYNLMGITATESYKGKWSDGRSTTVEVGVWGQNQPNPNSGNCIYVAAGDDNLWYTAGCDRVLPFACEMNPCPEGMFQCSGRCFATSHVCDGKNDCGDNRDELNCPSKCTFSYNEKSGGIQQQLSNGKYLPNSNCQWTIETTPGERINVQFEDFETEANTDFLEIWDGGMALTSSTLMSRLSGQLAHDQMSFTSSYNFLILRFVSDAALEKKGFKLSWNTEFDCTNSYKTVPFSTYSNTEIQEGQDKPLGSRQTAENCKTDCEASTTCYGFVYIVQPLGPNRCRFFSALPILTSDDMSTMYMKLCPPHTTLKASVSLPTTSLMAVSTREQLSTPLYPLPYIGNMELEYTISTEGNNIITLEVLDVSLCCDDTVEIYDGTADSSILLETLSSTSSPHLILSTSQHVLIRMTLENHWKCRGVLMTYKQGCDNTMTETGTLSSPGYGTSTGYPGVMECTWTLRAPSEDRSISVVFEAFDIEKDMDFLTIEMADGSTSTYTGSELMSDNSLTADNFMKLTLRTSAIERGAGFKASFSPGCSSLQADGVILDSDSYDYLNVVKMSCAEGYYFTGEFYGETEVTVKCSSGGNWDKSPKCNRGYCGPPPVIKNGYIVSSTGVQGGDSTIYECNSGFSSNDSISIKCNANHQWDMPPNCTSGFCQSVTSVITDVTATIIFGNGIQYGSVASLSCSAYREIHGAATVQCANGSWDFVKGVPTICHSKPCQTPEIENAYFTPNQPYVLNQAITVTCKDGYRLVGNEKINCGVTVDLPRCEILKCNLSFENVVPVVRPDILLYEYGQSVDVKCNPGLELRDYYTSTVKLTCLSTGQWSIRPSCSKITCGVPQTVKGSLYTPLVPCRDYGCNFTFSCKSKYELHGVSSYNDTFVRCGGLYDGLWDFGNLRCIGGQCKDPGYPPSGFLMATSFQEGSTVTFGCSLSGYSPVPLGGITCLYNQTSGSMEWDKPLPACVDTQPPKILNCPTPEIKIANMQPAGFAEPYATDNTYVKSFTISPSSFQNFRPDQPINRAMTIIYRAADFAGLTSSCNVRILIPSAISCQNSKSLNYLVQTDETINSSVIASRYVVNNDPNNVFLYYDAGNPMIQVNQTSSMLRRIEQVLVKAADKDQNFIESCRLQFRFRGYKCSKWGIHIPGGGSVNCVQGSISCNAYCNAGTYFMEDPHASSIPISCTEDKEEGIWNRNPPVCASASSANVVYVSIFDYKYSITGTVSNWTTCAEVYKQQLESSYPTLKTALQEVCTNTTQTNPVTLTIKGMTPASLSYNDGANTFLNLQIDLCKGICIACQTLFKDHMFTCQWSDTDPPGPHVISVGCLIQLNVRLEVVIDLYDETVDNVLALKDACTMQIQTAFNTNTSVIASIRKLAGQPTVPNTCGHGTYQTFIGTPKNEYDCDGSRKYAVINNNPVCLKCPLGYYMEGDNCSPCPDGTYGVDTPEGPACYDCPGKIGPGMTALTSVQNCSISGICPPGTYSNDGLTPCTPCPNNFYALAYASQSCAACPDDRVTNATGASSESECKTLTELGNEESVCNPNPCHNEGNCSFKRSAFFCTCKEGFTGRKCEEPFNACSSNPCQNYHTCVPRENNNFTCTCSAEYTGTYCEKDISSECTNSNLCKNNGTCHNKRGGYSCICPSAGGYSNNGGSCATAIDQCLSNPCLEGTCIPHGSYYRSCECYPGFTGVNCETNSDDCNPNPCVNGGVCVDGVNTFNCTCGSDYYGEVCQFGKACNMQCNMFLSVCNSCEMNNTAECENFGNSSKCHCKPGFTGTNCEIDDSECKSYPCQHGGTCIAKIETPGYTCACSEPWTGYNCETEKSNCPDGLKCHNQGTCFSTYSGYQCDCTPEYIGTTCNITYDLCSRVDACVGGGSSCSYSEENGFECFCGPGFSGPSCHIPDPLCTPDYCQNGGTCQDTGGNLVCSCRTGFDGPTCDNDVNDCNPDPCGANQQCIDMVNSYVCACDNGKRGEQCDKDTDDAFDYIIGATDNCRLKDNNANFSAGGTPISNITVAFWSRFTQKVGLGTIMNIYGSVSGVKELPTTPDFHWRFDASGVTVVVKDSKRRKKRAIETRAYGVNITDGVWHHVVLTLSTLSAQQEITIYVDGEYRNQLVATFPSILIGFLVLGDYDAATRTGDAENSFRGRLSRLYVIGGALDETMVRGLYTQSLNPPTAALLLHQESNLMLQYMIDFNSEITAGRCVPNDPNCEGLYTVRDLPTVFSCHDVLVVTERLTSPTWPSPTFNNTNTDTKRTNIVSGAAPMDWDIYGISVAEFGQNGNAAVCVFRLYNYPVGCTTVSNRDDVSCRSLNGNQLCEGYCASNEQLTGSISAYQTCSKYSMWGEALRQEQFNYPVCAEKEPLQYMTSLTLNVTISKTNCSGIKEAYNSHYQAQFSTFNSIYGSQLCEQFQCTLLANTFTCDSDAKGTITVDLGLLPEFLSSNSETLTPEEALKVAVADENIFTYEPSVDGPRVEPDWTTLKVDVGAACEPGYQVSGTACVQCGSGTYFSVSTSTCLRCPKGLYRDLREDSTTPTSSCLKCSGSTTTASDGSPDVSYCKANCLPGRYYNEDVGSCADCEIGFYQPEQGQFSCIACTSDKTTDSRGKTSIADCVLPESITTPTSGTSGAPVGPSIGAATETDGLSTGVIVAIVLGIVIGALIIVLVVCLCCYKCQVPCLAKKSTEISPEFKEKDRYYANKYGESKMKFVNYNLPHMRETKDRSLDKESLVEPPLSEESGSVKNDISIHVPIFREKIDGSVSKKHLYMSNNLNAHSPSPQLPMTSSPRANVYHDIDFSDERKHKKKRRKKSRKPAEFDAPMPVENWQIPKALAPLPQKLKSVPPDAIHLRPSSALERPREQVVPSHYENLLPRGSKERGLRPTSSSERELMATMSSERDTVLPTTPSGQGAVHVTSKKRESRRPPSPEVNEYEDYRYPIQKIEVESDTEDLR